MPYPFEGNQPRVAKILAQPFGGAKMHGAVLRPPGEQRRIVANFRQRRFKIGQVGEPRLHNVGTITEAMVLEDRNAVTSERVGRNFRSDHQRGDEARISRIERQRSMVLLNRADPSGLTRNGASVLAVRATRDSRARRGSVGGFAGQRAACRARPRWRRRSWRPLRRARCQADRIRARPSASANCSTRSAVGADGTVHALDCRRKPGAKIVDGINGRMRRKRRHGKAPRKRVAHQAMDKDQRASGASLEVTHTSRGEIDPALFDQGAVRSSTVEFRTCGRARPYPSVLLRARFGPRRLILRVFLRFDWQLFSRDPIPTE